MGPYAAMRLLKSRGSSAASAPPADDDECEEDDASWEEALSAREGLLAAGAILRFFWRAEDEENGRAEQAQGATSFSEKGCRVAGRRRLVVDLPEGAVRMRAIERASRGVNLDDDDDELKRRAPCLARLVARGSAMVVAMSGLDDGAWTGWMDGLLLNCWAWDNGRASMARPIR